MRELEQLRIINYSNHIRICNAPVVPLLVYGRHAGDVQARKMHKAQSGSSASRTYFDRLMAAASDQLGICNMHMLTHTYTLG